MDMGPLTLYAYINDMFMFVMLLLGVLSPEDQGQIKIKLPL